MDRCSHCGSELAPQARFCVACGNAVQNTPNQNEGGMINNYQPDQAEDIGDETVFMTKPVSYQEMPRAPYSVGLPLEGGPAPALKSNNTLKWVLGGVLVLLLLLGGAGYYIMKISNPEKVIASFAHQLEQGNYDSAYGQLNISDRNPGIRNLNQEKNFVGWQRTLDNKNGSIEKVEVTDISVDDWGWGSKESYASAVLNINRPKGSQEVHIRLQSNERKWLGVVPAWTIEFPTQVVDLSGLNLLNGTEVLMDGESLMTWDEKDIDKLKVETFAGDHLLTFKTPITRPVDVFPAKHLESVSKSSFQLMDEEDLTLKNAVKSAAQAETKAWESMARDITDLQGLTASNGDYATSLQKEVKDWITQNFHDNYNCTSIKRPLNVANIYNVKIIDSLHVECTADENYNMEVKYTDSRGGAERTWTDSKNYTVVYTLAKEGGAWKIASRRKN